jgi:hypothetical protein
MTMELRSQEAPLRLLGNDLRKMSKMVPCELGCIDSIVGLTSTCTLLGFLGLILTSMKFCGSGVVSLLGYSSMI